MFTVYLKEFLAIGSFLESNSCPTAKGYFKIKRCDLDALLNKNKYETAQNKLKVWKALHWITAEDHRLTKKIYEGSKYHRFVLIDIALYRQLKTLTSEQAGA